MNPDDPVCLCFHVTRRKVINYIRVEKPRRPSQLSQCFGAGTGCGWCRPYLERLLIDETEASREIAAKQTKVPSETTSHRTQEAVDQPDLDSISFDQYLRGREKYVKDGGGTPPPGATPIEQPDPPT